MAYVIPFEAAEFEDRIARVKNRMTARGIDLLICVDPANMYWLSGFDGWSFYTPQALLLHGDEDWPIWFGRPQDAKSAHMTTVLPTENITSYGEKLVHHPDLHPFDDLCQLILDWGWGGARIGVELDAHYFTARAHRHLQAGLPNAQIIDSQELVNWARAVKSPAELVLMREAGKICSHAMRRAIETARPGVPQAQVIAAIYDAQTRGVDDKCGDYTSICPLIQVGEGTSTPHLTWTDEPLPNSGLIGIELGGARRHYTAPLTRTLHLGSPPDAISDLAKVIAEGGDAAFEVARPGATCEDVEAVWQSVLRRHGYSKDSRVGYSIGVGFPPDWGERTMSLRPGDKTDLKEGMCFHFQSGVWLEDFGAAISEPIIITANGAERLCDIERELIVIS